MKRIVIIIVMAATLTTLQMTGKTYNKAKARCIYTPVDMEVQLDVYKMAKPTNSEGKKDLAKLEKVIRDYINLYKKDYSVVDVEFANNSVTIQPGGEMGVPILNVNWDETFEDQNGVQHIIAYSSKPTPKFRPYSVEIKELFGKGMIIYPAKGKEVLRALYQCSNIKYYK